MKKKVFFFLDGGSGGGKKYLCDDFIMKILKIQYVFANRKLMRRPTQ